jgi:hypothetical protein
MGVKEPRIQGPLGVLKLKRLRVGRNVLQVVG